MFFLRFDTWYWNSAAVSDNYGAVFTYRHLQMSLRTRKRGECEPHLFISHCTTVPRSRWRACAIVCMSLWVVSLYSLKMDSVVVKSPSSAEFKPISAYSCLDDLDVLANTYIYIVTCSCTYVHIYIFAKYTLQYYSQFKSAEKTCLPSPFLIIE